MDSIFLFLISVISFFMLGFFFSYPVRKDREHSDNFIIFCMGIWYFSFLMFILGILKLYNSNAFYIIFISQIILSLSFFLIFKKKIVTLIKTICSSWSQMNLFIWLGFLLFICLSPLVDIDALAYHLYCPKLFLRLGELSFIKYNANSLFPMHQEMLYLWALYFKDITLAKMFHFLSYLLLIILAYKISKEFFDKSTSLIVIGIISLIPGLVTNSSKAYVDITFTLFAVISFLYFLKWEIYKKIEDFILMSFFSGVSIGVKHLGVFVVIVLFFFLLRNKCKPAQLLKYLFSYISITFLIGGWWYLRAFLLTGNPFYPYLYQIFGPRGWHSDVSNNIGMGKGLWQYLAGFWNLTIYPDKFGGGANQIGAIFLCLIPLIFLIWNKLSSKEKIIIKWMGMFCILYYTLWFFVVQNLRFFYPITVILSIITGVIIAKIWQENSLFNKTLKILFIFLLCINFCLSFYYQFKKIKGILVSDTERYLKKTSRTYAIAKWVNKNISPNSRILICGEPALFYFKPFTTKELIFRYITQYHNKNLSPYQLYNFIKSEGFSYIILRRWYDLQGNPNFNFPPQTLPYLIIKNKFDFIKFLHKELFRDKEMGVFEYIVYKIK